jgi:hypothetical protein
MRNFLGELNKSICFSKRAVLREVVCTKIVVVTEYIVENESNVILVFFEFESSVSTSSKC